jgi:NAD-dependent deacetylase
MLGGVEEAIEEARTLLSAARRVLVLTGAGISTDSGIPDFRGPEGLWTRDPGAEMLSSYDAYVGDPELRARAWQVRLSSPTWTAEPNEGHRLLVELERRGVLLAIVTQNIDGLHQAAGSDPSRIIEIHGNGREALCLRCGRRQPMPEVLERVAAGERDPVCQAETPEGMCGGILKSATISFGQSLVPEDLAAAEEAALSCDLLLAIGSTLAVYPAANVVPLARRAGAPIVIVNGEATAMDDLATVVVRGDITRSLGALLATGA